MSESHAIVIGGSIAGLCAARVLLDHFDRVTVLDRDRFPTGEQHRKGVPQSRHPHAMLDAGRRELDRLFPGFEKLCMERGALELEPGLDIATLGQGGWNRRRKSPATLLFASRVLIEGAIRDLAAELPGLVVVEDAEVSGLLVHAGDPPRATGVEVRRGEGGVRGLSADLVVDASGRATRVPEWLEKLGLPSVDQTVVDAQAGYSSRWYQGPSAAERPDGWWWKCLWIEPLIEGAERPEEGYFGVLFPVEHDRWVVTTASWGGRELARDPETFEAMIGKLRTPILAEAIAAAEPISPVFARRGMQNCWSHYERWNGRLAGFVATGDAACAFNPVYGQGMSSASKCAGVLAERLERDDPRDPDFPTRFFQAQAEFLKIPWTMAISRDREQARVESESEAAPRRLELLGRRLGAFVLGQFFLASSDDLVVSRALFDLVNLTRMPGEVFRDPSVLARALIARARQLGRKRAQAGETPPYPPSEIHT